MIGVADGEEDLVLVDGETDGWLGVVQKLGDHLQGLARDDTGAVALARGALPPGHGQPAAVGGHQPQLPAGAVEQDAVDGVAGVLDRGGKERSGNERMEHACGDLAIHGGVAEIPHRRTFRRVNTEDLEMRPGAPNVDGVVVGLDGQRWIIAGAGDLAELVGGDRRFARLLDLNLWHGQPQAHLQVGGGDHEPVVGRLRCGELEAF